ncbi:MAG: M48 family metallopeptidase [Paludibacter sp.]
MESKVVYEVTTKEKVYFVLKIIFSLILYVVIASGIWSTFTIDMPEMASVYLVYVYIIIFCLFWFIRFGVIIGHLKGNGIKLNEKQFPEIYHIVVKQSELLGLKYIPSVYIKQSGGVLNAFASRFLGHNYIVLYSEIVETALEKDKNILWFIIGHELGHIKRNHMIKNQLLFPAYLVPFLSAAYSRACEYTCDNIGYALSPSGVKNGLLILAAGKSNYKNVNTEEYIVQIQNEKGFWTWFAEKSASHPHLTKRLNKFNDEIPVVKVVEVKPKTAEVKSDDHSRFFPKAENE